MMWLGMVGEEARAEPRESVSVSEGDTVLQAEFRLIIQRRLVSNIIANLSLLYFSGLH